MIANNDTVRWTESPTLAPADLKVIDADTHLSEPYDLWTSRVPSRLRDQVPHVVERGPDDRAWLFDGDRVLSEPAGSGSSIRKDGKKKSFWEYRLEHSMTIEEAFMASYDPTARLEMMDEQDIWAHIIYPNLLTFSMGPLGRSANRALASFIIETYNDAMAEMQANSGGRLFPMAAVPFWDPLAAAREAERARRTLDLRGIVMCSEPHAAGYPDLGDEAWNPLWEVCEDLKIPINLHVGATEFGTEAFLKHVWPSLDPFRKYVVGAVNIELHNSRVLANLLTCGVLERFPGMKWVSVESGIGWIPYVLERLEYQLTEPRPEGFSIDIVSPLELFRRQVYSCFWFERIGPSRTLDYLGFDNIMFETDFPHPSCKYPSAVQHGLDVLRPWGPEIQRKVMQDNAAALYRITV